MKQQESDTNSTESYWSKRYIDGMIGWDLGEPSKPLVSYIDQLKDKSIKILVPGAGNAYEVEYLFNNGFKNVYVMDVSELPLLNFQQRVANFPKNQIVHEDFFEYSEQFDLIIEQTFFCSFPPIDNNREKYVQKMYELLNLGGKLVGLWFNIPFSGDFTKRPFGCTKEEYLKLFSASFEIRKFEESYNSVENRGAPEFFGILEKR
ncbi:MAG: methyltransferase domain-containing protein [Flavobacteriaceae bacterium]